MKVLEGQHKRYLVDFTIKILFYLFFVVVFLPVLDPCQAMGGSCHEMLLNQGL